MESLFLTVKRPGLFRSSAWLYAWVKAWSDHPQIQCISKRGSFEKDTALLQPDDLPTSIFKTSESLLSFIPITSAYPFGVSSKFSSSIRSEYFQFPIAPAKSNDVCKTYFQEALSVKWDRFVFPDVLVGSPDYKSIRAIARSHKLSIVKGASEKTYGVNLKATNFDAYVKNLGKNTRLKLFNSRKKLAQHGEVKIENIWPDRDRFFDLLNMFHSLRWGKPCYRDRNEVFIHALLDKLPEIGGEIDFSVMTLNDVPISVSFDIHLNGRVYNLQSGYVENFAKGIALGTLHFGYQIEAAFNNENADYYDFMAGRGKNSDYKKPIANAHAEFVTLTLVRNRALSFAYKLKARLKKIYYGLSGLSVSTTSLYG